MILTGDIGGTRTRLALWQWEDAQPKLCCRKEYDSRGVEALADWIISFLEEGPEEKITGAALCCAGTKGETGVKLTNLPFTIAYEALQTKLPLIPSLTFHNDGEAHAAALPFLTEKDYRTIKKGEAKTKGTRAVIAPGTGLGEASLLEGRIPCPSEGGHGDFAPQTGEQWALYRFLTERYDHVSYERILSGPGLSDLHRFLSFMEGRIGSVLDANMISRLALMGNDPLCLHALTIFRQVLGAEAGNLALRTLALGGAYIGGGIVPQIAAFLDDDEFREAFLAKGRYRSFLEAVPIHIITNQDSVLFGAAALKHQRV